MSLQTSLNRGDFVYLNAIEFVIVLTGVRLVKCRVKDGAVLINIHSVRICKRSETYFRGIIKGYYAEDYSIHLLECTAS